MSTARRLLSSGCFALALLAPATAGASTSPDTAIAAGLSVEDTTRATGWDSVATIPLRFDTFHPQDLARVGDRLFLSAVEIIEPTERYPEPVEGYDRSPGAGVGHLFVLDLEGNLIADIVLGEEHIYHPGGIDTDGRSIWVPVAEYRPNSASILCRIDAESLDVEELFRVDDHIGGLVPDRHTGRVHGVSWGSRRLYTWTLGGVELERRGADDHGATGQDASEVRSGTTLKTAPCRRGQGNLVLNPLAVQ